MPAGSIATCSCRQVAGCGAHCETELGSSAAFFKIGWRREQIGFEADNQEITRAGLIQRLIKQVSGTAGYGQAEIKGWQTAGLFDDCGIDGKRAA